MNLGRSEGSRYAHVKHLSGTVLFTLRHLELWRSLKDKAAIVYPLVSILALGLGIVLGAASAGLSDAVNSPPPWDPTRCASF